MTSRRATTALVVVLVMGGTTLGFVLLEDVARAGETFAASSILEAFSDRVQRASSTSMLVVPRDGGPFVVVVTSSCSALASLLALACLALPVPPSYRRRLAWGALAAAATVAVGNVIRIVASVAVGLVAGQASSVLFHDWVGSLLGFAYTLGGYVLLLWLVLPRRHEAACAPRGSHVLA